MPPLTDSEVNGLRGDGNLLDKDPKVEVFGRLFLSDCLSLEVLLLSVILVGLFSWTDTLLLSFSVIIGTGLATVSICS
jgi:hypothetical protein